MKMLVLSVFVVVSNVDVVTDGVNVSDVVSTITVGCC